MDSYDFVVETATPCAFMVAQCFLTLWKTHARLSVFLARVLAVDSSQTLKQALNPSDKTSKQKQNNQKAAQQQQNPGQTKVKFKNLSKSIFFSGSTFLFWQYLGLNPQH